MCENRNVNRTILIVDDDEKIIKTLKKILKGKFRNILSASNPEEAILILKQQTVDVVFTDYYMQGSTGVDLLKFVNLNSNIPVVIMTGQANLKICIDANNYHAFKFIEKPISLEVLECLDIELNNFLNKKEKNENLILAGEATSTIIHEINNPLNVILLRCETLKNSFLKDPDMIKKLETIERNSGKISKIISQTRELFTGNKFSKNYNYINLNNLSEEIYDYVESKKLGFSIDLSTFNRNFMFKFDKDILLQVIFNLINNAKDAIIDKPNPWIKIESLVKNNTLFINIIDCGSGISPDKAAHIFDKGFSGKNSTGIGLFLCRLLLEQYNSKLYLNESKENTCFTIEMDINPENSNETNTFSG